MVQSTFGNRYRMARVSFKVPFGMSGSPTAFRPHLLDPELSHVKIFETAPPEYNIQWMCSRPSKKFQVRFLSKLPEGIELCQACVEAQKNRKYLAARGITMEKFGGIRGAHRQYLIAAMRGAPLAVASRVKYSKKAPF